MQCKIIENCVGIKFDILLIKTVDFHLINYLPRKYKMLHALD